MIVNLLDWFLELESHNNNHHFGYKNYVFTMREDTTTQREKDVYAKNGVLLSKNTWFE